jgi:replicative DNA helicase
VLTLSQGRRKNLSAGEPIHTPFHGLAVRGAEIRRSGLHLLAAGPGTGKSAIAQYMTQVGDGRGNVDHTLYFSADSDAATMFKRGAAIATGWEQNEVARLLRDGNAAGIEATVNRATAHMRWRYDSAPDQKYILHGMLAHRTVYGEYPAVVVVDNLKNCFSDGENEYQALESTCEFLAQLAKDTNAAILALHHVVGDAEDGNKPIPLSGLRGKVGKTPIWVGTLHRGAEGWLNMSIVKNRNGIADPSGYSHFPIAADLGRMSFNG